MKNRRAEGSKARLLKPLSMHPQFKAGASQGKRTMVDQAYELMREKIITLKFAPGMKLEEKDLLDELGLGRTPIREALRMLISEGLVVNYGSSASYVKDLTLKSAKDLLTLLYHQGEVIFNLADAEADFKDLTAELWVIHRHMDEAIARGELALYARINADFHRRMTTIANNEYLQSFIDRLYCEETRLSFVLSLVRVSQASFADYYGQLQKQHAELIELLEKRKFERMKTVYREHLTLGHRRLFLFFSEKVAADWPG